MAELAVGEARFRVADEAPEVGNLSPEALGGTSVRLNLLVADPNGVAAAAIANGAIEVAPVADQSYGLRQGRLADPFGHHWLIGRPEWPAPPVTGRGRPRGSGGVDSRLPCAGPHRDRRRTGSSRKGLLLGPSHLSIQQRRSASNEVT